MKISHYFMASIVIFIILYLFLYISISREDANPIKLKCEVCSISTDTFNKYSNIANSENFNHPIFERINDQVMERNAILGMAYGYSKETIKLFINSLKATNYNGDTFMFMNSDYSSDAVPFLQLNNINLLFLTEEWPYYSQDNINFPLSSEILTSKIPQNTILGFYKYNIIRYPIFLAFLTVYGKKYRHALMADTRDTVFQFDPFSWKIPEGISLFEESRKFKIFQEANNDKWLSEINVEYDKVRNNYILSSGIIFITISDGLEFLQAYNTLLTDLASLSDPKDQAIINTLIYNHMYTKNLNIFYNYFGPVRTLALEIAEVQMLHDESDKELTIKSVFEFTKDKKLLNVDHSIPIMVHQYDRFPEKQFENLLKEIYEKEL